MPSLEACCGFCGRRQFATSAVKGRRGLTAIEAVLYAAGWTGSAALGGWACSDDCRAYLARDVTPKTKKSPALGGAR